MPYILYQETAVPQTKAQKEKKAEVCFTVDRVKRVSAIDEANAWVNKDSESRSWSRFES